MTGHDFGLVLTLSLNTYYCYLMILILPIPFAVIGGWSNSGSLIRLCKGCGRKSHASYRSTPDILSSTEYRQFNVSFANDFVQVSKVGENEPFITYQNEKSYNVSYIGILTYWGSDGDWVFCGFDN